MTDAALDALRYPVGRFEPIPIGTKDDRVRWIDEIARAPEILAGRGTPETQPDPQQIPIAQLPESGRGLAVMRACVDNVTLDSRPGRGTVVTMRKRIRWPDDAPLRQLRAAS